MPIVILPDFFRSDKPERSLAEIRCIVAELQRLYEDADKAVQEPEIREAYKTIISHKGWLVSQKIIQLFQNLMSGVSELEEVEPYSKVAYSPYPFKS